ncbi:MAG: TIGR03085 family metal-binding protein [Segniliparus sp.]|uniref:TIGR03085 family metal-binding protein n=1 Tax=Segniliparus sp. TaxID=2804064 RepID=UPI003F39E2F5
MTFSQNERAALVSAARAAGPDAPTLCEGWTVRDLLAHLVLRESLRVDATAGIFVPKLAAHSERLRLRVVARDWETLLDTVASGPAWYSPFALVDRSANLVEMFVHTEDIARAQPGFQPRTISQGLRKALVRPLRTLGSVSLKRTPGDVSLVTPQGETVARGGSGGEPVSVIGEVEELLLFAFGREPANITLDGTASALIGVAQAKRGL